MISDFKIWFDQLACNAMERKKQIQIETGEWPYWINPDKNKEIKCKFSENGKKLEGIYPRSSIDRKAKEWLYDLIWREFDEEGNFIGVKLAMEIELSDMKIGGLRYDFNKLLQSDAEYKVFVFQQKTLDDAENIINQLIKSLEMYRHKSPANYLFTCWCWDKGKFIYRELSL